MMIGKRECMVLVSACAAALFTVGAAAATDPRAGNPEGERIALWPEGKVPSAEEHQYNASASLGLARAGRFLRQRQQVVIDPFDEKANS